MSDPRLTIVIDVPRGSFIKRGDDGTVDFVSLLPSPFNYGHVPGTLGDDGDAWDAVVLGPRLTLGTTTELPAQGQVGFVDAGHPDPKWICAPAPLSRAQRLQVEAFFRCYALVKRVINRARGKRGSTRYLGWLRPPV